jgi:hypothetical protein
MNVILYASHGMNQNAEILANTRGVGPHARLKFWRDGFPPVLRAEYDMNHALSIGVGHVSHLRRLKYLCIAYPALTRLG